MSEKERDGVTTEAHVDSQETADASSASQNKWSAMAEEEAQDDALNLVDSDDAALELDLSPLELANRLEQSQKALAHAKDEVLRLQADMVNIRKRAENDMVKARKFGLEGFLKEILPVLDSLELGVQACVDAGETTEGIHEGVSLTQKMLLDLLDKHGLVAIEPVGEKFDPEKHQAVSMQPADGEPGRVLTMLQKGYSLNGRVIRPAMVVVSTAAK